MTLESGPARRLCVAATLLLQAWPARAGETAAPPAHQGGSSFVELFSTVNERRRHVPDGWVNGDQRTNDAIDFEWPGKDTSKVQLNDFRAES